MASYVLNVLFIVNHICFKTFLLVLFLKLLEILKQFSMPISVTLLCKCVLKLAIYCQLVLKLAINKLGANFKAPLILGALKLAPSLFIPVNKLATDCELPTLKHTCIAK